MPIRDSIVAVLLAAALGACSRPPEITHIELVPSPNPAAPLGATLRVRTDVPTRLAVTIRDGERETIRELDGERADHEVILAGCFRPGRAHEVQVAARDAKGRSAVVPATSFMAPALPDEIPPIDVRIARPARMEPGITLVPLFRWNDEGVDEDFGLILGLDGHGDVVWYCRLDHTLFEPRRTGDGLLRFIGDREGRLLEMDALGRVHTRWHTTGIAKEDVPEESIPVATDTFHHEVLELDGGRLLAFSSEVRRFEDYSTSDEDPDAPRAATNVIGDVLVEFARDGRILRQWRLLDLLDPYRVSHGSTGTGFWKKAYKHLDPLGRDWAHANSIHYDAAGDAAIVSLNHQSALVKLDLASGAIRWILGEPGGWNDPWRSLLLKPEGDLLWPSNQHAARVTPRGTILLFDNGTHRGPPFCANVPEDQRYSRVVEYQVDEAARTVRQLWSYGGEEDRFYSGFLGDVDLLPATGNLLVNVGAASKPVGEATNGDQPRQHRFVHVFELERDSKRKVFEIVIDDPRYGWSCYRTERVAEL